MKSIFMSSTMSPSLAIDPKIQNKMTREEKSKAISELTEKLGASTNLYL